MEICKPVKRDDRTHVEYTPSQVISEYIRDQCEDVFGIIYPSRHNSKGKNIAFFPDRCKFPQNFIKLVDVTTRNHE